MRENEYIVIQLHMIFKHKLMLVNSNVPLFARQHYLHRSDSVWGTDYIANPFLLELKSF